MSAIRKVLASFRSEGEHVTEEDLQAAWAEYDALHVVTDAMVDAGCQAAFLPPISRDRRADMRSALVAALAQRCESTAPEGGQHA